MQVNRFNPREEEVSQFLQERTYGVLGLQDQEGWPYAVPVNFVYREGKVYFHGAGKGKKGLALAGCDRVSFCVADEYGLVPSYWLDPHSACPAGSIFKSVIFRGRARLLEETAEKARALTWLMEKLQPEGGYSPIDGADPAYAKVLEHTAVYEIEVVERSVKFKFGQHRSGERNRKVIAGLKERNRGRDREAAALIESYGWKE